MANNLTLSVTLTGDGRQLSGTLRSAQGDVREFSATTERESRKAETSLTAPGRSAATVSDNLRTTQREARTFGTETAQGSREATQALTQTGTQAQSVTNHLSRLRSVAVGVGLTLVSMVGGLSFGSIISETAAFEDSILGLQAVSSATQQEMVQLERQSRQLGATSMFSAQQSADAQRFLAQAGFDVLEVMSATPGVLQLATAGQMDLAESADIASNVLGGMRLEVDQLNRVNNVLAATSSGSNTNIRQLGEAFSYAGPFAASAGVSIETTAAAIGVLSDAGLQASRAGTGVIGIIRQLSNVTPQAAGVLASYGLTIQDVNIEAHGLETVLERIRDAQISTADAFAIFGSEAGAAAQILAAGAGRVREFSGELDGAEDAVGRMAMIIGSGLTGSIRGFNSMMSESILQLGESGIAGAFELVVDNATGVLAVYNDMLPILAEANDLTDEQVARIEMLASGIGLLGDAVLITGGIIAGRYVGAIATSQAALAAKTVVVATTTGAINVLTGATTRQAAAATLMAGATRAATSALMLMGGPLGLLVGAGSLLYLFREELGLTTQKAGLTEQQVIDLRNELREMSQEDLSDSLDSLNQALTEAALKAATAREELAKLRAERDQGQGPRAAFRTLEAGGYESEINGMRALQEAEEKLLEIEQRRNATYRESVRQWKERKEATDAVTEATEENGVATEVVTEVTRQATNTVDELTKATNAQAAAIENLRNRLVPHRSQTLQLAQDQNTLNLAFAMGRITASEYLYMIGALQTAYIDAQNDADDLATSTTNALYTMEGAMEELRVNGLRRLDDGFADLWLGAVDGSRSATDTIKRVWDQTLAELLHMAVTRPITVQLAASMGLAGGAGGQQAGGFGISPGSVGNMWNALQGGLGGIQWGGAGGAQAYGGGGWANTATQGTGATGFMGGSMQNFSGMEGLAGLGAGLAGNWLGGQLFGQGKHSSTLGTIGGAVGTYFGGPLGAFVGSGLGSALGGLFGGGKTNPHLNIDTRATDNYGHGSVRTGAFGSVGFAQGTRRSNDLFGGIPEEREFLAAVAASDDLLASLARSPEELNRMATAVQGVRLSASNVEGIMGQLSNRTVAAVKAIDGDFGAFVSSLGTDVDTIIARTQSAMAALNLLGSASENLNLQFDASATGALRAADNIAQFAGGVDQLNQLQNAYYQAFFTDAERAANLQRELTSAVGQLGYALPSTRDGFRSLVEQQDQMTESGQQTYVQLLQLAGGFDQLQTLLEQTGVAVEDVSQNFVQLLRDAESALASAEQQARRAWQAFDQQQFGMQLELLALMGDSEGALALERERELASIDESLRPMRERIWAMQDEAEAQQRATQAAQGYIRELTRVRDQLSQQLGSISGWLDQQMATSGAPQANLATAQEQFARQLVRAENGDRDALQSITQYAQQVLDANQAFNASSPAGQRIEQDVFSALKDLPKALSDAEFIVEGFRGIVTDEMAREIERAIFASQYTIDALIDFAADASALPQDLRTILGEQAHRLDSTLNYLLGENQLDSELRQLALASSNNLVATVDYIARSQLSNSDKLLALSSSNTMTALIDYVVGTDIDRDSRVLALEESNRYSAIVNMLLGRDISADDRRLALESVNGFTAVVDYVIRSPLTGGDRRLALSAGQQYEALIGYYVNKDISKNDRTLALNSANRYLANVEFIVGRDISSSDRRLALNSNNRYVSTIDQLIGKQIGGGDRRLALNSTNAYLTTVDAVLKRGIPADVRTFGLANSNAIMTTVDGILASGMSGDVRTLALKSSNRFVTTLEAALKDGRITGDERKLLDARSADVIKTLKTSGSLNLTQDEWAVINAASGTQRLQLLADVAFGRTDLDKLDNIDDNTKPLAEQARDQLKELNGLVSEMTRSTNQFVGLNSTMVSLRESINALGVANAERARIERERAAAEQAERDRIERERKQSELAAQRSSLQNQIGDYQGRITSLQSAASGINVSTASIEGARDWRYGAQHIQSAAQTYINAHGVSQSAADRFLAYFTTGAGSQERSGRYALGGQFFSYIDAYAKEIANTAGARGTIAELNNQIAELQRELKSLPSVNGSHRTGLEYVPFDGYLAELHRGEKVLTAEDADAMRNITIARPAPLPSFPLLGNSDIVETLRDLKREVAELRRDNARLQSESNKHLAAANNQRGAAATQQIAATERGNRMLKKLEDDKRLEAAKR